MALISGTQYADIADTLYDTSGDDQVYGFGGDDVIYLSTGSDYVEAGTGNDQVTASGLAGNKQVFLGAGDDYANLYSLNNGNARVYGGDGIDLVHGSWGNDSLYGDAGNDVLLGRSGADLLIGGLGEDILAGGDGNDTLQGADGNDQLGGWDGDDRLRGGRGSDELSGGTGADRFIFDDGETGIGAGDRDSILDFDRSDGDRIDVTLIDANVYVAGDQAFTWRSVPFFDAPGQLNAIYDAARGITIVAGNTDNDSGPELEIEVIGTTLGASDFFL